MATATDRMLGAVPAKSSVLAAFRFHINAAGFLKRRESEPQLGEPRPDLVQYHTGQAREMLRRIREGDYGPDRLPEPEPDHRDDEVFFTRPSRRHVSGRPPLKHPCGDA